MESACLLGTSPSCTTNPSFNLWVLNWRKPKLKLIFIFNYFLVAFISILFLLVTIVVNCYFKELRTYDAGKSLLCFLIGVLVTYIVLPTKNMDFETPFLNHWTSIILGIGFQLTFFWLNVLSFDIWWTSRWVKVFFISEKIW